MHALPIGKRLLVSLLIAGVGFVIVVYAASEWKIRRTYDIPLSSAQTDAEPDLAAGERMSWLPDVQLNDRDIADLYEFLARQCIQ